MYWIEFAGGMWSIAPGAFLSKPRKDMGCWAIKFLPAKGEEWAFETFPTEQEANDRYEELQEVLLEMSP